MAKLTEKQKNLVYYTLTRTSDISDHLNYEEVEKILALTYEDLLPEDVSVLVGDVATLSRDEREGVKVEDKKKATEELRSIIKQYESQRS